VSDVRSCAIAAEPYAECRLGDTPATLAVPEQEVDVQYVVTAWDGTDGAAPERRQAARPVHLQGIAPLVEQGRVLVGGAILDDAGMMIGSVLIVDFERRDDLDECSATIRTRCGACGSASTSGRIASPLAPGSPVIRGIDFPSDT
jgi:uncharacterized protein YciI